LKTTAEPKQATLSTPSMMNIFTYFLLKLQQQQHAHDGQEIHTFQQTTPTHRQNCTQVIMKNGFYSSRTALNQCRNQMEGFRQTEIQAGNILKMKYSVT
jgi:hypothetical protein